MIPQAVKRMREMREIRGIREMDFIDLGFILMKKLRLLTSYLILTLTGFGTLSGLR
jgi:hypothetical protein